MTKGFRMTIARIVPAPALLAMGTPAWAHPGHDGGLLAGLAHPWTGMDHLLAMTMVGVLAAARAGRAFWAWPAAFLGAMMVGFALGRAGIGLPLVEPTILASVILLGLAAAAAIRVSVGAGAAMIGLFGLCHGHAHGVEAGSYQVAGFAMGFFVSTAILHLLGMAGGVMVQRDWRRAIGAGAALTGLGMAFA